MKKVIFDPQKKDKLIFDGYPRNLNQTKKLDDLLKKYNQKRSRDYEWAWEQFYHSNGTLVWACRGVQTGQFAEKINKIDAIKIYQHLIKTRTLPDEKYLREIAESALK